MTPSPIPGPASSAPAPFDRDAFATFRFVGYEWDAEAATARLRYALDDRLGFTEEIEFPGAVTPADPARREALDACLWLLHLAAGVSYYKTAAPPRIDVETGSLSPSQAAFLDRLYVHGLAEFAWRNAIDLRDRVRFPHGGGAAPGRRPADVSLARRTLVPVGGGKDSAVTLEALRTAGGPVASFSVGLAAPIAATVAVAGTEHVQARRRIAPALLEANAAGALNGHVPVTAIVSSIAVTAAVLHDFDAVAMSNERSASVGSLDWDGLEVNHQWSKGIEFERDLISLLGSSVVRGVEWFSFLRPLSELAIAREFARLEAYHPVFTSCNTAFRLSPERRSTGWCGDCPKCRFVFLILAPFVSREQVVEIFGRDLLDAPDQLEGFMALIGFEADKPFECVGEVEESAAALRMLVDRPEWRGALVVRHFAAEVLPRLPAGAAETERLLTPSDDHCLPPRFEASLRALLGA
jgi:UDP-N-acetyl-alpha-D-muramoyl-L-alanyl-L-glutamate epimerase